MKDNNFKYLTPIVIIYLVIFTACLISDYLIPKSFLSIPLLISTLSTIIIIRLGIPKLKSLNINQIIRIEGPKKHIKKSGTPTMGGILMIPTGVIIGSVMSIHSDDYNKIVALLFITISFMIIGAEDDWKSLTKKTNKGLSVKSKLFLQTCVSLIFLYWSGLEGWINSNIPLPMGMSIEMGIWIWPLAMFIILAESNATNLTDGLDGLASGCAALIFTGMSLQLILRESNSDHLIAVFSIAMAGAWLGFLIYNKYPAKIFMGDTGSLAMGASLSGIALLSNNLWPLLIMGGVFLAESLSVIIQVCVFKITKSILGKGKRIFKMAPLHHHFELMGFHELNIVKSFWTITASLIIIAIFMVPTN